MNLAYWILSLIWIIYAFFVKRNSTHHLYIAFGLFLIAAFLRLISFSETAEPIMKISLLGWFIGMILILREYHKS